MSKVGYILFSKVGPLKGWCAGGGRDVGREFGPALRTVRAAPREPRLVHGQNLRLRPADPARFERQIISQDAQISALKKEPKILFDDSNSRIIEFGQI